jgi:hypothetical protein
MASEHATDDRTTYEPSQKSKLRTQFRPTSAPRGFCSAAVGASGGEPGQADAALDRRDRPTSAPLFREGVVSELSSSGWDVGGAHVNTFSSRPIDEIREMALDDCGHGRPKTGTAGRPPRALESRLESRPLSIGARHRRPKSEERFSETGALRFMESSPMQPPKRLYSPMTSPQTNLTCFQPVWALSNHRQKECEMLAQAALDAAVRPEASGHSSHRPASVNSSLLSSSSSRRPPVNRASAAGPFHEIPRVPVKNPLAQRTGG